MKRLVENFAPFIYQNGVDAKLIRYINQMALPASSAIADVDAKNTTMREISKKEAMSRILGILQGEYKEALWKIVGVRDKSSQFLEDGRELYWHDRGNAGVLITFVHVVDGGSYKLSPHIAPMMHIERPERLEPKSLIPISDILFSHPSNADELEPWVQLADKWFILEDIKYVPSDLISRRRANPESRYFNGVIETDSGKKMPIIRFSNDDYTALSPFHDLLGRYSGRSETLRSWSHSDSDDLASNIRYINTLEDGEYWMTRSELKELRAAIRNVQATASKYRAADQDEPGYERYLHLKYNLATCDRSLRSLLSRINDIKENGTAERQGIVNTIKNKEEHIRYLIGQLLLAEEEVSKVEDRHPKLLQSALDDVNDLKNQVEDERKKFAELMALAKTNSN